MITYHHAADSTAIAELTDENFIIASGQDILDIIGDLVGSDCSYIIIHEKNLHPDFFNLKSGLAGEILQKFSNYKVRLSIVGDFKKYQSKSFQDLIRESNKSNSILFLDTLESALTR
jgi:hypothetical protein